MLDDSRRSTHQTGSSAVYDRPDFLHVMPRKIKNKNKEMNKENLREQNMDSHHQEGIYLVKLNFERTAAA